MRIASYPAALLLALAVAQPAAAWNPFGWGEKKKPVAPMPVQQASANMPIPVRSLDLSEEAGPWHILAATFSGEGAEEQARNLCVELRPALGLSTYLHDMKFDNDGDKPLGRGLDRYGAPIRMKYRTGGDRQEWAVLVGDYPAFDDSIAVRDLAKIKRVSPQALLPDADGHTTQNFAGYRQIAARLSSKQTAGGPMHTAFITRNPVLPEEYFVPKGVDKFVEKMNKDVDHSALDIKGRYAVKVASFKARGTLIGASQSRSKKTRRGKKKNDALVEAAWNAHCLCGEMRSKGWEAYEYHDRTESCVMVGSFDSTKTAGGQPVKEVADIVRTFGAAYDTPPTPLSTERLPDAKAERSERLRAFNNVFTSEIGQVAGGMNPKYAHVKVSDNQREPLKAIPFDIHPHVVEAPKRSVSSGFAWRR